MSESDAADPVAAATAAAGVDDGAADVFLDDEAATSRALGPMLRRVGRTCLSFGSYTPIEFTD